MADLVGFDDLDEFGAEIDDPIAELEQDLYHRLTEPYGSNLDIPADASLGVQDRLNGIVDASLGPELEAGLKKDDRVRDARATITDVADGTFEGDVQIQADEGGLGITFDVDASGVRRIVT